VVAPGGYEVLVAHCESWSTVCQSVQITGNRADEEAWGIRATGITKAKADTVWATPGVYYAVGDRARCDQVRAVLSMTGTSTEECWGPTYFRRQ